MTVEISKVKFDNNSEKQHPETTKISRHRPLSHWPTVVLFGMSLSSSETASTSMRGLLLLVPLPISPKSLCSK